MIIRITTTLSFPLFLRARVFRTKMWNVTLMYFHFGISRFFRVPLLLHGTRFVIKLWTLSLNYTLQKKKKKKKNRATLARLKNSRYVYIALFLPTFSFTFQVFYISSIIKIEHRLRSKATIFTFKTMQFAL